MVRKIFKWTGIVLGSILLLALIAYLCIYISVDRRLEKRYDVAVRMIDIKEDSAAIAEGGRLFIIKGCADCHGKRLEGAVVVDDPALGRISGANLTHGIGGLPVDFDNRDWLLALRHGIRRDGKPLLVMPSYEFASMDDRDIASIIAFCKVQPPVNNELPPHHLGPLGRVLTALGKIPLIPAERVDHHYRQPERMAKEVSPAYGKYLAVSCTGCHQPTLKGGDNPVPGRPQVANITSSGHVGKWTPEQFIHTLRTGQTPEGKMLRNDVMPWQMTAQYTDDELKALYLYLRSL